MRTRRLGRTAATGLTAWALLASVAACGERAAEVRTAQRPADKPKARPKTVESPGALNTGGQDAGPGPAATCKALQHAVSPPPRDPLKAAIPSLEGATLSGFFEALATLQRGRRQQPVRVAFYGDSNLTLDGISGMLRRRLLTQFGDGGHGLVAVGNPFRGYRHMDLKRRLVGHWLTYIFTRGPKPPIGGFGAAGMVAATGEPKAKLKVAVPKAAPVGKHVGRFGVFYEQHAGGGPFAIQVDGKTARTVDGRGPAGPKLVQLDLSDAPHRFVIQNLERKTLQLYGVFLERQQAGVIVEPYAVTGSTFGSWSKLDAKRVEFMLEARPPDLVIYLLGTNFWNTEQNPQAIDALVAQQRRLAPTRSLLLLTPPDHTKTKRSAQSDPRVLKVVEQLREATRRNRIGLWDFYGAMGGAGSMSNFVQRGLAGKDLYHLSPTGARIMGARLAHALNRGYAEYLASHPQAGCPPGSAGDRGQLPSRDR